MTHYDDVRTANAAAEAQHNETQADLVSAEQTIDEQATEIEEQAAQITDLEEQLADCEGGTPPEPPTPSKFWIIGMATEQSKWDQRVNDLLPAPTNSRRLFKSSWTVQGLVDIAKQCHNVGCFPYVSAKMSPSSWAQVASGALDTQARDLAKKLVALGYPVRVTFHHEPRGGNIDTPEELIPWADALTRLFTQMRGAVTDEEEKRLILGPTDNGHPWGQKWGTLTDSQLNVYYKQALLDVCDVMGADFYDGATDTNVGEPAHVKMLHFADYFNDRNFVGVNDPGWKYDAGEWNFVKAKDCDDTLTFLRSTEGKDFNCMNLFNSAENNRDDLPSELNGSWELVPGTDRMEAYKEFCIALAGADTRSTRSHAMFAGIRHRLEDLADRLGDDDPREPR